jgi:hypothetical protein
MTEAKQCFCWRSALNRRAAPRLGLKGTDLLSKIEELRAVLTPSVQPARLLTRQ